VFQGILATLALAAVTAAGAAAAQPHHGGSNDTSCFFINQWDGWKAPDDHTLYLGVNYRDVYEVQLADSSPMLQDPNAHIISDTRGPYTVCNPVDLQLAINEPYGLPKRLVAKSLVKLTPEQVKAIPRKYRPF
jgi:Family of unknown function (DUF6491)